LILQKFLEDQQADVQLMSTFWSAFRGFEKAAFDPNQLKIAIQVVKLQKQLEGDDVNEGVCEILARKLLGDFMD